MPTREPAPARAASRPADHLAWSAALVQRHRHALVHVLIEGGAPRARLEVARSFHDESPVRAGGFVVVDAMHTRERLRDALLLWAGLDMGGARIPALAACERGTLFVDQIESLEPHLQRIFHTIVCRTAATATRGPARIIVGSTQSLAHAVAARTFLPELHDALDKVRVALPLESEAA